MIRSRPPGDVAEVYVRRADIADFNQTYAFHIESFSHQMTCIVVHSFQLFVWLVERDFCRIGINVLRVTSLDFNGSILLSERCIGHFLGDFQRVETHNPETAAFFMLIHG